MERNLVRDNNADAGILINQQTAVTGPDPAGLSINNNCIENNNPLGAENRITYDLTNVNMQSNWWGAPDGPGPPDGPGSGDGVDENPGMIDFSNFLTERPECGAPPITPAEAPCLECEEFPCGLKFLDMRQICSRAHTFWFFFRLGTRAKTRCVKARYIDTLFEMDSSAVCGACPK